MPFVLKRFDTICLLHYGGHLVGYKRQFSIHSIAISHSVDPGEASFIPPLLDRGGERETQSTLAFSA